MPRTAEARRRSGDEAASGRRVEEAIVALWRGGIRVQGEIGRRVGLDQRNVSRRIAGMLRAGTWPFEDRPARGRVQVPVAAGFVALPIPRPGRRDSAGRRAQARPAGPLSAGMTSRANSRTAGSASTSVIPG